MIPDPVQLQCEVQGAHTFEKLTLNRTSGDDHVDVRIDRGGIGQVGTIRVRATSLSLAVRTITETEAA